MQRLIRGIRAGIGRKDDIPAIGLIGRIPEAVVVKGGRFIACARIAYHVERGFEYALVEEILHVIERVAVIEKAGVIALIVAHAVLVGEDVVIVDAHDDELQTAVVLYRGAVVEIELLCAGAGEGHLYGAYAEKRVQLRASEILAHAVAGDERVIVEVLHDAVVLVALVEYLVLQPAERGVIMEKGVYDDCHGAEQRQRGEQQRQYGDPPFFEVCFSHTAVSSEVEVQERADRAEGKDAPDEQSGCQQHRYRPGPELLHFFISVFWHEHDEHGHGEEKHHHHRRPVDEPAYERQL